MDELKFSLKNENKIGGMDGVRTENGHPSECDDEGVGFVEDQLREDFKRMCRAEGIWPFPQDLLDHGPAELVLDRYLLAKNKRLKKALKMLKETLEWREENKMGTIIRRPLPEISIFAVRQLTYAHYHCTDRKGRPVMIERLGRLHLPTLRKLGGSAEDYYYHHIQLLEYFQTVILKRASVDSGHLISMHTVILDLEGAEISQTSSEHLKLFKSITNTDQSHYPEIAADIFILNAPKIFRILWQIGRPFIEKRVRDRIFVIAPEKQREVMTKIMDEDYLPVRYGGKDTSCSLCSDDTLHIIHRDGRSPRSVSDVKSGDRAKRVLSCAFYKEMDNYIARQRATHENRELGRGMAMEANGRINSKSKMQISASYESESDDEYYSASESF